MSTIEIISLIITIVCLLCFSVVFVILFRHYYLSNIQQINEGKEDINLIDNALTQEKEKHSKKKKAWKITGRVLEYIILVGVIGLFCVSLYSRVSGNVMVFGNSTQIVIGSGSMSKKNASNDYLEIYNLNNQFDTYDVIGIDKYKSKSDVALYDVVAYKNDNNVTIVHRIIKIVNLDGIDYYITRGDSNNVSDNGVEYSSYLTFDKIIGKYNDFRIKGLGSFIVFLQSNSGIITIVAIVLCLIIFDYYSSKYSKAVINRTNMLVELIDYDLSKGNIKDVVQNQKETILYQGNEYSFQDGKFLSKKELPQEEYNELINQNMVVIDRKEDKNNIKIKNTKTNEINIINNASDEDLKDPTKYIKVSKLEEKLK